MLAYALSLKRAVSEIILFPWGGTVHLIKCCCSFWVQKWEGHWQDNATAHKVPGTFQLRAPGFYGIAWTKPSCYVRFHCIDLCQPWGFWRCLPSQLENKRSTRLKALQTHRLVGHGYLWSGSTHLSLGRSPAGLHLPWVTLKWQTHWRCSIQSSGCF